jgi:hypothetical protein
MVTTDTIFTLVIAISVFSEYVWRGLQCFVGNHGYWTDFDEICYDLTL